MNRRSFLTLLSGAAAATAVNRKYFFAPASGWVRRESGVLLFENGVDTYWNTPLYYASRYLIREPPKSGQYLGHIYGVPYYYIPSPPSGTWIGERARGREK